MPTLSARYSPWRLLMPLLFGLLFAATSAWMTLNTALAVIEEYRATSAR